ncbi:hypothetical protein ES288_D01G195800v1 [Gossypium darwinii]|uniref:Uncharacterized protein n=1 Tax=Gossypium darwinii TaxID=34276 RepID=A0A5D2DRR2_GOSDA|nr:hypothetical protein ES288_D01G195800v1 [Gossypium darwinii]
MCAGARVRRLSQIVIQPSDHSNSPKKILNFCYLFLKHFFHTLLQSKFLDFLLFQARTYRSRSAPTREIPNLILSKHAYASAANEEETFL